LLDEKTRRFTVRVEGEAAGEREGERVKSHKTVDEAEAPIYFLARANEMFREMVEAQRSSRHV
jgi:hypothetical protein